MSLCSGKKMNEKKLPSLKPSELYIENVVQFRYTYNMRIDM